MKPSSAEIAVMNDDEIIKVLMLMSGKDIRKAHIATMRKAALFLRRKALANLKQDWPNVPKKNSKGPSLQEVKAYAGETQDGKDYYGKVISKPRGMLKWLIIGTKERKRKDDLLRVKFKKGDFAGQYRMVGRKAGKITGKPSIKRAEEQYGDEAIQNIEKDLNINIQKQFLKSK